MLLGEGVPEPPGDLDRLVHGQAPDRDERHHVHRAHARMGTHLPPHVDQLDGPGSDGHRARLHRIRFTEERAVGPVVVGVHGKVENLDRKLLQNDLQLVQEAGISPFAEVRDTLQDLYAHTPVPPGTETQSEGNAWRATYHALGRANRSASTWSTGPVIMDAAREPENRRPATSYGSPRWLPKHY